MHSVLPVIHRAQIFGVFRFVDQFVGVLSHEAHRQLNLYWLVFFSTFINAFSTCGTTD